MNKSRDEKMDRDLHGEVRSLNLLRILFFCVIQMMTNICISQNPASLQFGTRNGLLSNEVYHIHQDKYGVLWLATDLGICSYNGTTFEELKLPQPSAVFRFYEQADGEIWFITSNNDLYNLDVEERKVHSYEYNDLLRSSSLNSTSNDLYIDKDGVKVVFWEKPGYVHISDKGVLMRELDSIPIDNVMLVDTPNGLTYLSAPGRPEKDNFITELDSDERGYHFLSKKGDHRVISNFLRTRFYNGNKLVKEIDINKRPLSNGFIDQNTFWVAYLYGGIEFYNLQGDKVDHLFKDQSVTFVIKDHQDSYWVSTLNKGLYYFWLSQSKVYLNFEEPNIDQVYIGNEIRITSQNGSIYSYNAPSQSIKLVHSSAANYPSYLFPKYDELLGLTDGEITVNNETQNHSYFSCSFDNDTIALVGIRSSLYLSSERKSWEKYDIKAKGQVSSLGVFNDEVLIAVDKNLISFSLEDGKERVLFTASTKVKAILTEGEAIYVGTKGDGVYKLIDGEIVAHYSKKDGLSSNYINDLFLDSKDALWIGTFHGLNRLSENSSKITIHKFGQQDGLPDGQINDIDEKNGILWVATANGLVKFNLNIQPFQTKNKHLFLRKKQITINGESSKSIQSLSSSQNNIVLHYEAISFLPDPITYRYKFKEDTFWTYTQASSISLEALSPGSYTIIIQAGVGDVWDPSQLTYSFKILPPFYRTYWFILSVLASLILIVYLFFRFNILKYNRKIIKEILKHILKKIAPKSNSFIINEGAKKIRINSDDVHFVRASRNYIEIHLTNEKLLIRQKISAFPELVPDPTEYMRVSRSYIVRVDKIKMFDRSEILLKNERIKFGSSYKEEINRLEEIFD